MLIAYMSRTGNVRRFAGKLDMRTAEIDEGAVIHEPFIFVTYTTGFGEAPAEALRFLRSNARYLRGVAASGNRNWGACFAKSADLIASLYQVPVIAKFELSGTPRDVEIFKQGVKRIASY